MYNRVECTRCHYAAVENDDYKMDHIFCPRCGYTLAAGIKAGGHGAFHIVWERGGEMNAGFGTKIELLQLIWEAREGILNGKKPIRITATIKWGALWYEVNVMTDRVVEFDTKRFTKLRMPTIMAELMRMKAQQSKKPRIKDVTND
jgi:ribosomal protein S27AE